MAVINPPLALQNTDPSQPIQHSAELFRSFIDSVMDYRGGIVSPADLQVTENGTPNMSVNVLVGAAFVRGSSTSTQGMYFARTEGVTNVEIPEADATDPRIDLVVAQIHDGAYDAGSDFEWDLEVVEGTPDPAPEEPEVPASSLVLAVVAVAAQTEAITDADITDRRTGQAGQAQAATLGGLIVCESGNKPDPNLGRLILNKDTTLLEIGTGEDYLGLEFVGNPDYAIVARNTNQSIPHNTWTPVAWNTPVENPFNLWAAAPNPSRITFRVGGLYQVEVHSMWVANASGDRGVRIRHNGTSPRSRVVDRAAGGLETAQSMTRRLRAVADDWITVEAIQTSGGALNFGPVDGDSPRLSVKLDRS